MKLRSTLRLCEAETCQVLSWLDEVLERGTQALQRAQGSQAAATREIEEMRAEAVRSSLAAQADMQDHKRTIQCLQQDIMDRDQELVDARARLGKAAVSAENLAETLAEQECEIFRLQAALKRDQEEHQLQYQHHESAKSELIQMEWSPQGLKKVCHGTLHAMSCGCCSISPSRVVDIPVALSYWIDSIWGQRCAESRRWPISSCT